MYSKIHLTNFPVRLAERFALHMAKRLGFVFAAKVRFRLFLTAETAFYQHHLCLGITDYTCCLAEMQEEMQNCKP
jgi:hypothetical protein